MKRESLFFLLLMSIIILPILSIAQTTARQTEGLEEQFKNPPVFARPYVWWHWMGSNFSKEGITKDLEAMKAQGIGGATIFNLSSAVQESHAPTLNNPWPEQTYRSPAYWEAIRFAASEARRLGLEIGLHNTVGYSTTGGPWINEQRSMQHLVWSDTTVTGGGDISLRLKAPMLIADEGWGKTGRKITFYKDLFVLAVPAGKRKITSGEVLELTTTYQPESGLKCRLPSGNWTIYRMGHAAIGRPPHPIPDDVLGKALEADKMSKEQSVFHWNAVLDPFKEHLGEFLGNSFKHMLIDSYEAGNQNWTPGFREEFIKKKGYDPVPWIAAFTQTVGTSIDSKDRRIIESEDQTSRFDRDYKDAINQLFFDNGWNIGKQKLKEAKLNLQMEPYGGPFETPRGVALADVPMAEFWTGGIGGISPAVPASARAAGKTVVGAEAFTGRPETSQFTEDPAFLKPSADKNYALGINRMILHHWVHQPFDDRYQPGMGMGWWGTHFGRNQTWAEPGKAFFSYLGRCQVMLQYGEQPADYLCLDKVEGYADLLSTSQFLSGDIKVKNGKIFLSSGRTYAFLFVPGEGEMLPEVARKIKRLVAEGATVVAIKPLRSPSLKDYPQCDEVLKKLGNKVWGSGTSNKYKNGFIFTRIEDALAKTNVKRDFQVMQAVSPSEIKIAHRHTPDTDLFFVANQSEKAQTVAVSFRISGKMPELWQAEDGSISRAPVWEEKDGRTTVWLNLKGIQSVFVVFRSAQTKTDHAVAVTSKDTAFHWNSRTDGNGSGFIGASNQGQAEICYASGVKKVVEFSPKGPSPISGPWKVTFSPKNDKKFEMDFPALIDFSQHSSKEVNYFSGTATYRQIMVLEASDFKENQRIILDLGVMNDIAEVHMNGKSLGVLWYPPYSVDVTEALKTGENQLEIAVTNNWANRLIGDEKEPADFEWGKDRGEKMGRAMLAYPDWFIKNLPRPSQGRKTFSIWYYYRNDSKLKPAGLVGPVRLVYKSEVKL